MIHLVSGKGGVGKSTVAAALAFRLAARGRKTLLVELGERSYYRHVFHADPGATPMVISSSLSFARWEGEACLREYLKYLIKIDRVVKLFFDNRVMRALVQAAPALKELALLGKITAGPRRIGPAPEYDELVVDAYATGHFRALWRAPVGLGQAIPFGPMGEQSRGIVEVTRDPKLTKIYVVALPEELPVTEGLELAADVKRELGQSVEFILNRRLDSPLGPEQLGEFDGHDFAEYLGVLLGRQDEARRQIAAAGVRSVELPWVFAARTADQIRALAGADWGAPA